MPHDTQSLASFPTSHAAGLELLAAGPRLPRLDLSFGATLPHRVQRPMVLLGQKKKGNKWSVAVWDTNGIMVRLEMLAPKTDTNYLNGVNRSIFPLQIWKHISNFIMRKIISEVLTSQALMVYLDLLWTSQLKGSFSDAFAYHCMSL